MKRPLGIWILLSAGVLWLSTQDVHGIRATSLILAKTSTATTTSTAATTLPEEIDSTEAIDGATNSTKPALTGIPQIDYIYDPNLPKELNGYNLSDYPFYERVPENITFKCDGLHDGFYASVPHKCQVYHHCLFGVRYDFLCANYTAFDQTLFNCNFVSNVDCENSKKFWNRNDELYKAKSTTPPPIVYTFYTQSPPVYTQGSSIRRVPQRRIPASVPVETPAQQIPTPVTLSDNVAVEVPSNLPPQPAVVEIPLEPRRRVRPPMRVRPYYDYYEDYDEPPRYIRKRPRPRPLYDDDDYEYYDDRFYRRNEGRRRRPYDRPIRRYKGRRDRYEDEEYDDYVDEEDSDRRKINRGSAMSGNTRYFTKRKPSRVSQTSGKTNRRPIVDEEYEDYDKKPANGSPRNRNPNRRPAYEYEDVDLEEINQKTNKKSGTSEIPLDESKTIIKPNSGTIFDRPRIAPKINLPVPKNVAEKYSYKAMSSKPTIKEVDNSNEQENEGEQDSPIKSDQSSNEGLDVTTIKGSFKRTLISRRPSDGKVVRSTKKPSTSETETEKVDEEIQESKTNTRQMAIKTKNQPYKESVELSESSKKEVRRLEGQDRQRGTTKFNSIYKTRHSLSTPEAREFDNSNDFTDIDDSINEA
ncbi:uncharacterized protein LOC130451609 isoform X1 [Diorhabda sublineata]|uniref:uncharacterized protein LOC130451609 isoform X1 n=1 Tax=Diorhabda sublineata TaxID=1163346 RepID=UPI0024E067EB|nr:uncharacterized protein LOC130451609 isoform X1 [Diorhabda sublineata]